VAPDLVAPASVVACPLVASVVLASVAGCLPVASVAGCLLAALVVLGELQGDNPSGRGRKLQPLSVHVVLISKSGSIH
jgi:hypothetical protein